MDYVSAVGFLAALLTTASNLPQAVKCWRTGETHDISLKAFIILTIGLTTWVVYGVLKSDLPLIVANTISAAIALSIVAAKLKNG
jgi:MtN3 and saliva related transmembrane protein